MLVPCRPYLDGAVPLEQNRCPCEVDITEHKLYSLQCVQQRKVSVGGVVAKEVRSCIVGEGLLQMGQPRAEALLIASCVLAADTTNNAVIESP